ncbi:hypothetical protein CANMA_003430 [Candida margitis]|uniref:uncharacterized protein n=1 Tax=Candida margitis TaxID=1775924 RepID=UPI002227ED7D|nr:uncharacterized protein CANMA_003430 [Candida margitis]KAI5964920.1 hypothetical protein CANMA_003430 [Candida margitis]
MLRNKRKFRKPLILIFAINLVYILTFLLSRSANKNIDTQQIHISIEGSDSLPQLANTDIDYAKKLEYLLTNIEPPKHTTTLEKTTQELSTIRDSNLLYQDDILTFGSLLDHIIAQDTMPKAIPFQWSDWVDLSYLNHQLNKPVEQRLKCRSLIHEMNFVPSGGRSRAKADTKNIGCIDTETLTDDEVKVLGFQDRSELPGFVQFRHTPVSTTEYVRNLQGKTYILTYQPLPYKVIFLNDYGEDLVFDVYKGRPSTSRTKFNIVELFEQVAPNKTYEYSPQPIIELEEKHFTYNRQILAEKLKQLNSAQKPLDTLQQSYFNSMVATVKSNPSKNPETRYFKEATLHMNFANSDSGWHYDWRFFNGKLGDNVDRTSIIMERLSRNWFKFSEKHGIVSWIAHGPLLSWYWNGGTFPFDNDLDIQMPIEHLLKLGELYNQTLVVEDLHEGTGKFLIEVGTFVHNRHISKRGNHIDARFIDIDTGIYIDITGLSTSGATPSSNYYQNVNDDMDEGPVLEKDLSVFNDRRVHFYNLRHLSPLKLTMLNGVPCYIPNSIIQRLKFEYPDRSLTRVEFKDWYFVNKLQSWIHEPSLIKAFDPNDYMKSNGRINKSKLKRLIQNLSDEEVYQILTDNHQVLIDYFQSQSLAQYHQREIRHLFKVDSTMHRNVNDLPQGKILDNPRAHEDQEYINLIEQGVQLKPPVRESLFEYEKVNGHREKYNQLAFEKLDKIEVE